MKPLYTTIKVTEKTQTQKLPVIDQIKLLLGKVSQDEAVRLEASEKISRANLEMESALSNLISEVTSKMKDIGAKSVTVAISSRFKPYFESVMSPITGKGRFYKFEVEDKEMPIIGADYYINVRISERDDY